MMFLSRLLKIFLSNNRYRSDKNHFSGYENLQIDIASLQNKLGLRIGNADIYTQALIHRSYFANGNSGVTFPSNERLEFFGDSVLSMIVSEYLHNEFPNSNEGELTKFRSRLINGKTLAYLARKIDIPDFIFISPGARQSVEHGYDSLLADAYEAIIAAIYLDHGYKVASDFVTRQIAEGLNSEEIRLFTDDNYKSLLIEYTQANCLGVPRYDLVGREGPDHDQTFTVEAMIEDVSFGRGKGKSKKEAEQNAARIAYQKILKDKSKKPG